MPSRGVSFADVDYINLKELVSKLDLYGSVISGTRMDIESESDIADNASENKKIKAVTGIIQMKFEINGSCKGRGVGCLASPNIS